jgi:hypothetical protein
MGFLSPSKKMSGYRMIIEDYSKCPLHLYEYHKNKKLTKATEYFCTEELYIPA